MEEIQKYPIRQNVVEGPSSQHRAFLPLQTESCWSFNCHPEPSSLNDDKQLQHSKPLLWGCCCNVDGKGREKQKHMLQAHSHCGPPASFSRGGKNSLHQAGRSIEDPTSLANKHSLWKSRRTPFNSNTLTMMDGHITVSAYCQQISLQKPCCHFLSGSRSVTAIENVKYLWWGVNAWPACSFLTFLFYISL